MAIKPVDVRRKEFKNSLRGYDANQVDDFLDEVADEFERSFSENQRMKDEISSLRGRLEQFEELEGAIREALVHAQQVARDLRRNANKEAELVVREAKEQAHRILADSSARVERVQDSYGVLQKAKQDFQNDFRHLLKSYLAVMENADVASAKEIEASLRERLDTESIAAARQAADTRRSDETIDETAQQDDGATTGGASYDGGDVGPEDATQRIELAQPPSDEANAPATDTDSSEIEEPEIEPLSTRQGAQTGAFANASSSSPASAQETGPLASFDDDSVREVEARPLSAEEVDREEPALTGEGPAYDRFFEEENPNQKAEESRIFRASRFLRRRG